MTFTEEQVTAIVVEVIRRLGLVNGQRVAVSERSSTTAELLITDKVITLQSLEGRLGNVTRLIVEPRAVVTPAAKDELNARKIEMAVRPS